MSKITDFLVAKDNYISDKISQTIKFAVGAAATTGLIWLTNAPALISAATAATIFLGGKAAEGNGIDLEEKGAAPIFRGMLVAAAVLSSAHLIKTLETAKIHFDRLQTLALQGLPVAMSFTVLTLMTDAEKANNFFFKSGEEK
jgi:hypothetical protein